jgi:hypothetical protein
MACSKIPCETEQGICFFVTGNLDKGTGNEGKRPFLAHLRRGVGVAICSRLRFADEENKMANEKGSRARYDEAF